MSKIPNYPFIVKTHDLVVFQVTSHDNKPFCGSVGYTLSGYTTNLDLRVSEVCCAQSQGMLWHESGCFSIAVSWCLEQLCKSTAYWPINYLEKTKLSRVRLCHMLQGELHLIQTFSQVHLTLLHVPKCHQCGRSYHNTCPNNRFFWFYR